LRGGERGDSDIMMTKFDEEDELREVLVEYYGRR
jgi:hypothetical protein